MSERYSSPTISSLSWLLAILLVGIVALLLWQHETTQQELTARGDAIALISQELTDTRANLEQAKETRQAMNADMARLTAQNQENDTALRGEIAKAVQANSNLQAQMQTTMEQHAATLAAEREQANNAIVALQQQQQQAQQQIANLSDNIQQLQQNTVANAAAHKEALAKAKQMHEAAMAQAAQAQKTRLAEAASAHQAAAQKLQARFNDQIAQYRLALEGSDPERAAQINDLTQRVFGSETSLEQTRQALTTEQQKVVELNQHAEKVTQANREFAQTVFDARQSITNLTSELDATREAHSALQAQHEQAVAEATTKLANATQQLENEQAVHAKSRADAEAMVQNLQAESAAALAQAKEAAATELTTIKEQAATELAAAQEQAATELAGAKEEAAALLSEAQTTHANEKSEVEARIAELTTNLETQTAALAALQTKHDGAIIELNTKLADAEKSLASTQEELTRVNEEAKTTKETLSQQITEAEARIAEQETNLTAAQEKAKADVEAARNASAEAMTRQRGLFAEYSALGGRQTERGVLLSLAADEQSFAPSSAELPSGDLPSLDAIAKLLIDHPDLKARVEGHTDSRGSEESNLELSQKRAEAVRAALVERQVDEGRITAEGIGAARPIADNANAAGRRKNRRVEIYALEK